MGTAPTSNSRTTSPRRWAGPTLARHPRSAQRGLVGAAYGRGLGRYARALSAVPDLPPPIPAVGQIRGVSAGAGSARRRLEGAGRTGFIRVFHRWHLCDGKKGGLGVGKTKRGKGTKLMALADRTGLPLAVYVTSASPHEVTLVERTLETGFLKEAPQRLIADRAYDSDPLDSRLRQQGIELIAPHKANRIKPNTQDGRSLRRYRHRWRIERLFAWLQNFKRLVTRYEYHLDNFLGFVHLGCILIFSRRYL
jgi:transposase